MTRDEIKSKIDDLMDQYDKEEIDGATYAQQMMDFITSAKGEEQGD